MECSITYSKTVSKQCHSQLFQKISFIEYRERRTVLHDGIDEMSNRINDLEKEIDKLSKQVLFCIGFLIPLG